MSQHHPSCKPSDRELVWLCNQCGGHEPASELEERLEQLQKAVNSAVFALTLANKLPTNQGCPEENHSVVLVAMDALTAIDAALGVKEGE